MKNVGVNQMKAYLRLVMQMESDYYASRLLVAKINNRIKTLNNQNYYDINNYLEDTLETNKKISIFKMIPWWVYIYMLLTIPTLLNGRRQIKEGQFTEKEFWTAFAVYAGLFIFFIILALIKKIVRKKDQKILNRAYKNEFENSKQLQAKNSLILKSYNIQSTEANRAKNIAYNNLKRAYAENILPPQYRNFAAAATMYQWLEYGICTQIYGHGGLFDRYDYELKFGRIIGTLDNINNKLNIIAENQQMLYDEIQDSKSIAQKAFDSIKNIEKSNQEILKSARATETSTAITAMESRYQTRMQQYIYYQNKYNY